MRTIAGICQKGGTGKTTLLVNMAACAVNQKPALRTWVVDMDPQASAYRWGEERSVNVNLPRVRVEMAHTARTFRQLLDKAKQDQADLVLIDSPQATSDEHFAAIGDAHVVMIPCKPSFFDVNAALRTLERIAKERRDAFVLFAGVEKKGVGGVEDVDAAKEALAGAGAKFAPFEIHHNPDFPHAAELGQGVEEFAPMRLPAREMRLLTGWALGEAQKVLASLHRQPETFEDLIAKTRTQPRGRTA